MVTGRMADVGRVVSSLKITLCKFRDCVRTMFLIDVHVYIYM